MLITSITTIFIAISLLYIIAQKMHNNGIVDIFWGPGIFLAALSATLTAPAVPPLAWTLLTGIALWAFRLAWHIGLRNRGKKEDWRYQAMRKNWKHPKTEAYFKIFMLQGLLMLLMATPAFIALQNLPWPSLFILIPAALIYLTGLIIETVADYQLKKFIQHTKSPHNVFCTTGLWGWSRHPNYVGEVMVWWGVTLSVITLPYGWMALLTAVMITLLIRYVSGVPYLEKKYSGTPQWDSYCKTTPIFFPFIIKRH